jgi:hypothetical protein
MFHQRGAVRALRHEAKTTRKWPRYLSMTCSPRANPVAFESEGPGAAMKSACAGDCSRTQPAGVPAKVGTFVLPVLHPGGAKSTNLGAASPNPVDSPSHLLRLLWLLLH